MRIVLLTIFVLSALIASAQYKQKIADDLFARLEYSKCVEMYEELAKKCVLQKKNANWENVRKAAESNYHLFNMDEAVHYYSLLNGKNMLTEHDREWYIEALRYSEEYEQSNELLRESANLFPNNEFFNHLKNHQRSFESLFKDSSFISVWEASINSGKGDFAASYSENGIVFASKAKNTGFLNGKYAWDDDYFINMMSSSLNSDSSLAEPELMRDELLTRAHDGPVSFSPDFQEMVVTSNVHGKNKGKEIVVLALYFATKSNEGWSELKPFPFNNDGYNVGHGVFADENTLYFASDKPGGYGEADLYVSKRVNGEWMEPQNLGNTINTSMNEFFPFVQEDKLFFASDGHFGLGGLDIFEAKLSGDSDPINLGYPINSPHDDFSLIFDQTGRIGFLSSNRGDNIDRIYHVKRETITVDLICSVFEKYDELESVANQLVYIQNMTAQQLDTVSTGADGTLKYSLEIDQNYQIYTKKKDFILLKEVSRSTNDIRKDSTLTCELVLKPTKIDVHLRVIEKETGKIIPEATTSVRDYAIDWDTTMITNSDGTVTLTVDRNKVFWAHGAKKGYIDADISFNTSNEDGKVIDIPLALSPIRKGEKFKLENIFYDLNKSSLRPESMASLDKLADFLLKNDLKIELSAHTDSRGSNSYNQRLSQARAQSCVDYLLKKGVKPWNIKAKGYGESQLVNKCSNGVQCTEDEHQENRRTEVKILEVR